MQLIDKHALLDILCSGCTSYSMGMCRNEYGRCAEYSIITHMPTIEAEPVRHGRWIVHTTWHGMFGLIHSECSECKFDRNGDLSSWKFCPNCGARMDGGADNG